MWIRILIKVMRICRTSRLRFEPFLILNFDFIADPNPSLQMRIQVQHPKIMLIHADPDADPKPLFVLQSTIDLLKRF
jgi:hypothetical protein